MYIIVELNALDFIMIILLWKKILIFWMQLT